MDDRVMWLASRTSAKEHEETGHYHSHSGCGQRHQSKRNDPRKRAEREKHPITSSSLLYSSIHIHAIMPLCFTARQCSAELEARGQTRTPEAGDDGDGTKGIDEV